VQSYFCFSCLCAMVGAWLLYSTFKAKRSLFKLQSLQEGSYGAFQRDDAFEASEAFPYCSWCIRRMTFAPPARAWTWQVSCPGCVSSRGVTEPGRYGGGRGQEKAMGLLFRALHFLHLLSSKEWELLPCLHPGGERV